MDEIQKVEACFFDIDDIIAKSETTTCTFEVDKFPEEFYEELLGLRKPTHNANGLSAEAPFWIIESVKANCTVSLPQCYGTQMQSVLNADAKTINLARCEQYFYTVGIELCQLLKEDDPEGAYKLSKCLLSTLTQRLGGIVSSVLHEQEKVKKLAALELKIYESGKKHKMDIDDWLRESSNMLTKKRKRGE